MSVGHLDHVLVVYSSMEHVIWKSLGPMSWYDLAFRFMHIGVFLIQSAKVPTQQHMGPGDFQVTCSVDL